jgi:hypothetical protein
MGCESLEVCLDRSHAFLPQCLGCPVRPVGMQQDPPTLVEDITNWVRTRIRGVVRTEKRWFVQCPRCLAASPSGSQLEVQRWALTHVCEEPPADV